MSAHHLVSLIFSARNLSVVSPELPFELKAHKDAGSVVARLMTNRLKEDMSTYASEENEGLIAQLKGFSDSEVNGWVTSRYLCTFTVHFQVCCATQRR